MCDSFVTQLRRNTKDMRNCSDAGRGRTDRIVEEQWVGQRRWRKTNGSYGRRYNKYLDKKDRFT